MTKKLQILVFTQSNVGGAERMSVFIGKALPKDKFNVTFCLVKKGTSQTTISNFIPNDYKTITIQADNAISATWKIQKTIIQQKPDIVFSSVLYLNDKILPLKWLFPKTKFVVRCENYLYTFNSKQQLIVKLMYDLADAIIAQTAEMKDELIYQCGISQEKVHTVENPVDTETINANIAGCANPFPDNAKKHFLASGRFAYQKGFDLLVEAFSKLRQRNKEVDLYIIGQNNGNTAQYYETIIEKCKELCIIDDVHCLGFQANPYLYVKYADAFVLSSRWEGLPNVLIEAQYLGTPAAAFKCIPIIERIIKEGVNGFLAEKDDVEQLSKAMEQALNLGRIQSTYTSATIDDFQRIFESVLCKQQA